MEGAGEGRVGAGATAGAWQAAIAGQGGGLQPPPWVQGRAQPAPHRPTTTANGSTRSMTHAQATQPLEFYDIWVARDADGRRFTKAPPHASDPYSVPRATAGLPFPVSCCWNGLVALPAAPFRDAGLRVRAAGPGECAASECSHLCNDLLKLGAGRMLVDPGVRVAYLLRDAVQARGSRGWGRGEAG